MGQNKKKEFKIGVLVLLCIALLYFGINFLKGINIFQKNESFYAVYSDVDMLAPSYPVVYKGLKVGLVKKVFIDENDVNKMVVEFIVRDSDLKIPEGTVARIESPGILGTKYINLLLGNSNVICEPGDTLDSAVEMDLQSQLEPIKSKAEELVKSIDEVITNLNNIFADGGADEIPEMFSSLQVTLKNMEHSTHSLDGMISENRPQFKSLMSATDSLMSTMNANSQHLVNIIYNFENISDSLAKVNVKATVDRVESALAHFSGILDQIENGDGSMSKLLKSDEMHNELVQTNEELQLLLNDLRENPGRYVQISVFGKRQRTKYSKKELKQLKVLIDEALKEKNN